MLYFLRMLMLLLVFSLPSAAVAKASKPKKNPYVILDCRENSGMFSIFHDVLALLKYYDKGQYSGIEVDFQDHGLFYSEEHGNNWWTYYCEPIVYGKKDPKNVVNKAGDPPFVRRYEVEAHTTRLEAYQLIDKYIKFKPHITNKIDAFVDENFSGYYVFGIHYRGTDKFKEAPRISYGELLEEISKDIEGHKDKKIKIFVATDEGEFIDYMKQIYGDKVCYYEGAARSADGTPIHYNENNDPYFLGEEAIIDSLLLSKTDYLFRTSSNLSLWSTFFSPDIPVVEITRRGRKR